MANLSGSSALVAHQRTRSDPCVLSLFLPTYSMYEEKQNASLHNDCLSIDAQTLLFFLPPSPLATGCCREPKTNPITQTDTMPDPFLTRPSLDLPLDRASAHVS